MKLHQSSELKEKRCEGCFKLYTQTSPRQKYCSIECRPSTHVKSEIKTIKCKGCDKEFESKILNQKFCTVECRDESRKLPLEIVVCLNCHKEFRQGVWSQVFCSNKCRNDESNRKAFRIPQSLTDEQRRQVIALVNSFDRTVKPKRRRNGLETGLE